MKTVLKPNSFSGYKGIMENFKYAFVRSRLDLIKFHVFKVMRYR